VFLLFVEEMYRSRSMLYTTMCALLIVCLIFKQSHSYIIGGNPFKNPISSLLDQNASKNNINDPLFNQFTQLTKDLWYMSESDYPFEPVSFSTPLTNERLVQFAQEQSPTGTRIEQLDLSTFLQYYTSQVEGEMIYDLATSQRFQALEAFMKKELNDVHVYRVGDEPRIVILALGTTKDGKRLIGFRTVSIET
jgi:hypothetical protein